MKKIGAFLSRFQSLTPPNDSIKVEIARAVSDAIHFQVSKKGVELAHGVAFIAGSSIMKNAIALKRGEILASLYEALPKARESVRDVR